MNTKVYYARLVTGQPQVDQAIKRLEETVRTKTTEEWASNKSHGTDTPRYWWLVLHYLIHHSGLLDDSHAYTGDQIDNAYRDMGVNFNRNRKSPRES